MRRNRWPAKPTPPPVDRIREGDDAWDGEGRGFGRYIGLWILLAAAAVAALLLL